MLGKGYLHIYDYDVLFKGYGSLQVGRPEQLASVNFTGTGTLYANGTSDYIRAFFPAMAGQMFETVDGYGGVNASFPAMSIFMEEYAFVPAELEYIFAMFPAMVCSMTTTTIDTGEINATFPALVAKVYEEEEYGEINVTFPAPYGLLFEGGPPQEAWLIETILCLDAARGDIEHIIFIDETGTITDIVSASRILIAEILEQITATDSASLLATFYAPSFDTGTIFADASAEVGTRPGINPGDRVWVVNIDTGASGQYDNFGYNSFFDDIGDGKCYGLADDGIYELTGETDAGINIDALIEDGRSDYGSPKKKSIVNVYAGVSSTGKMLLKVDADGQAYIYEALSSSAALKNHRFDIGRGVEGNYYNLTLLNQNGCDFDLETIHFEPIALKGKI